MITSDRESVVSKKDYPLLDGIIEIRDPEINVEEVMRQIRENMSQRKALLPSFHSMILAEDRLALRAAHETLRAQVDSYGNIGTQGPGLKGKIQFFIKRVIRRVIRGHIEQGRCIQESMLKLTGRLITAMDQHLDNTSSCVSRIEKLEKQLLEQSAHAFKN